MERAYERGHQWLSRKKNKGIDNSLKITESNVKNDQKRWKYHVKRCVAARLVITMAYTNRIVY